MVPLLLPTQTCKTVNEWMIEWIISPGITTRSCLTRFGMKWAVHEQCVTRENNFHLGCHAITKFIFAAFSKLMCRDLGKQSHQFEIVEYHFTLAARPTRSFKSHLRICRCAIYTVTFENKFAGSPHRTRPANTAFLVTCWSTRIMLVKPPHLHIGHFPQLQSVLWCFSYVAVFQITMWALLLQALHTWRQR